MKFEYEMEARVSRYALVDDALRALYGGKKKEVSADRHIDLVSGLMDGTFRVENRSAKEDPVGKAALEAVRRQTLTRFYEGELSYTRTCAYVSFENEIKAQELVARLAAEDYLPASLSESVAYLRLLRDRGVTTGTVLHLGARVLDEAYREQRLVTSEDGGAGLVPFYEGIKLKPYYHVVAVKKEKATHSHSVIFGRKK